MASSRWQEVSPRSSRGCCLQRSFPKVGGEAEREVKRGSFQASLGQPWVCSGPAVYRSVSLSFQLCFIVGNHRDSGESGHTGPQQGLLGGLAWILGREVREGQMKAEGGEGAQGAVN